MEKHAALMTVLIDISFSWREHVRNVKIMIEHKMVVRSVMLIHVLKETSSCPMALVSSVQILKEDKKVKLL